MQEAFTVEAIHAAAFANNTVGLPKICPGKLNTKLLKAIYAIIFRPVFKMIADNLILLPYILVSIRDSSA